MKPLSVSCPVCLKIFNYYDSEFRPFCCERCRFIDLGQWLNETYKVPVNNLTPAEAEQLEHHSYDQKQNSDEDDQLP
jgi:endogenous inhibitor of DNA gyrase (YacG/DUF329 family)